MSEDCKSKNGRKMSPMLVTLKAGISQGWNVACYSVRYASVHVYDTVVVLVRFKPKIEFVTFK